MDTPTLPQIDNSPYGQDIAAEHFDFLGYSAREYHFFQRRTRQMVSLRRFSLSDLLTLAPIDWWRDWFATPTWKVDLPVASDWLIQTSRTVGLFDASRVRGTGIWRDQDEVVANLGSQVVDANGVVLTSQTAFRYVYAKNCAVHQAPLSDDQGRELLSVLQQFPWQQSHSAHLALGWLALAPLAGLLHGRPHILVTAPRNTELLSILQQLLATLLGQLPTLACETSAATEIIRATRQSTAPLIVDAAEQIRDVDCLFRLLGLGHLPSVDLLGLAWISSAAPKIRRRAADAGLVTLELSVHGTDMALPKAIEAYADVQAKDYGARLLCRALKRHSFVLECAIMAAAEARRIAGDRNSVGHIGMLLGASWSLSNSRLPTTAELSELLKDIPVQVSECSMEAWNLLVSVMETKIPAITAAELSAPLSEFVRRAAGYEAEPLATLSPADADATLQRCGIRVIDGNLLLANNSAWLRGKASGTSYASEPRDAWLQLPGASNGENRSHKFGKQESKVTAIPLAPLMEKRGQAKKPETEKPLATK